MKANRVRMVTAVAALLAIVSGASRAPAQYSVLHNFPGFVGDGINPHFAQFALSNSTLYGMTVAGGGIDRFGTVFRMDADGGNYSVLHVFENNNVNDGNTPYGSVTLSGSFLYGMTYYGGAHNTGVVFRIGTDGNGFNLLHSFNGTTTDGANPYGSLTVAGSTIYGMTTHGGASSVGTVFKIGDDGNGFTLLHSFDGSDGSFPYGALLLDGSTLYGMTESSGTYGGGTIFKIGDDGNGFSVLHHFDGAGGSIGVGALTLSGTTLYGMTAQGGASSHGTIFKMDTDGNNFDVLHSFAGGDNDGSDPSGSLTLSGSTLYGMTPFGGTYNRGTVFQIGTDGNGFTLLRSFAGGASDGSNPQGTLTLQDLTFYGMTSGGGPDNFGTAFALGVPEPSAGVLIITGLSWGILKRRRRNRPVS